MCASRYHPETRAYLKLVKERSLFTNWTDYTPEIARQERNDVISDISEEVSFVGDVNNLSVPSTQVTDGIPITVYKPTGLHGNPAVLIYFHGGGMVIGSRAGVDATCCTLARETPCVIVNVEYRLAPEHKFPASFEDAECVTRWVISNKCLLGGNAESKVGVAGDSSGGTLAATLSHQVQGIQFQILVYPRVNAKPGPHRASSKEYEDGPVLTKESVSWYRGHYLRDPSDANSILLNPYFREGFERLPPALLVVAECDLLRDDSYDYQLKMNEHGVRAELLQIDGASHSFFTKPGVFKECCSLAYERVAQFISEFNSP